MENLKINSEVEGNSPDTNEVIPNNSVLENKLSQIEPPEISTQTSQTIPSESRESIPENVERTIQSKQKAQEEHPGEDVLDVFQLYLNPLLQQIKKLKSPQNDLKNQ